MMHGIVMVFGGFVSAGVYAAEPMKGWSNQGVEVELPIAIEKYALASKLISIEFAHYRPTPEMKVRVVEGDLTIDGPLLSDWEKGHGAVGLIVTGSLVVSGAIINASVNSSPFLLVEGNTRARAIVGGGSEFLFVGDAVVDEVVIGEYNDGILRFCGSLKTPVAITNDHHFEVRGALEGRWLDPFDGDNTWASVLHRWSSVLHPDIDVSEDFDISNEVIPRLLSGAPVLRSDLPPIENYPHPLK